eukprot:TRINITY_DN106_c3_g1_i1.p1 TRINITY_DN106_c3_g1~~TRINITY_DN106_c3_g1_i1.p1  ORF type:complete len:373 (+),score=63.98 TRINITY_DN106_c3_g1_i1:78-1121(+)
MNPVHAPQDGIIFSILLSSVILMGSLAWMVYEFTDEKSDKARNDLVLQFNKATDAWEATNEEKTQWNSIESMTARDSDDTEVPLEKTAKGDVIADKHQDVHSFDSFHFEGVIPTEVGDWFSRSTDLSLTINLKNKFQQLSLKNITTTRTKVHRTSNWKQCQNTLRGSLNSKDAICTTYETLSEICIVVTTTSGGFRISGGCSKEGHTPEPFMSYVTYPSPRYDRGEVLQNVKFSTTVIIRADHDPVLSARDLTHGSTKFGQTKGERLALGYAALGCAIVSGCMLAFSLYQWKTSTPPHKYTKHSSQASAKQPSAVRHERDSSVVVPRKSENSTDKEMVRYRDGGDMV